MLLKLNYMKYTKYTISILFFIILSLEVILRCKGYNSLMLPKKLSNKSEKEKTERIRIIRSIFKQQTNFNQIQEYFIDTSIQNEYAGNLKYTVKQRINGSRYAGSDFNNYIHSVNLYGCSFTFGTGLNDTQTCAYFMQKKYPAININNFGVGGAGIVDIYDKILTTIDTNTKAIIINYAFFQTDRIPHSRFYAKMKYCGGMMDYLDFLNSYSVINTYLFKNKSTIVKKEIPFPIYQPAPLQKYSALINYIDDCYCSTYERKKLNKLEITYFIFSQINDMCNEKKIKLLITNIDGSKKTNDDLKFLAKIGIHTLDLNINNSNNKYNLLPFDGHPNELANKLFAKKIIQSFFSKNNF